ncbi:MAG: hypothetical protein HKN91_04485 [Acidimicrobiia bacterium]|nr:hypothetical protein [Acidimicrobiia bacterium]
MRSCQTSDDLLFAFVDGLDESLDEHVENCDECQAFLAELWQGELTEDLTEPVMERIRLAEFVANVARFGADVAAAMGRAVVEYSQDAGESVDNTESDSGESADTE